MSSEPNLNIVRLRNSLRDLEWTSPFETREGVINLQHAIATFESSIDDAPYFEADIAGLVEQLRDELDGKCDPDDVDYHIYSALQKALGDLPIPAEYDSKLYVSVDALIKAEIITAEQAGPMAESLDDGQDPNQVLSAG